MRVPLFTSSKTYHANMLECGESVGDFIRAVKGDEIARGCFSEYFLTIREIELRTAELEGKRPPIEIAGIVMWHTTYVDPYRYCEVLKRIEYEAIYYPYNPSTGRRDVVSIQNEIWENLCNHGFSDGKVAAEREEIVLTPTRSYTKITGGHLRR